MRTRIFTCLLLAAGLSTGLAACKRKDENPPPPPESSEVDSGTAPAPMPEPTPAPPPATSSEGGTMDQAAAGGSESRTAGTVIDDATITAKVKTALAADPTVKAHDINVDTRSGAVSLAGQVDNQAQIDRAVQIAQGTEGVVSVQNQLSIRGK